MDVVDVQIAVEDPASADARRCIEAYLAELDTRFEAGFDPAASISADAHELTEPAGLLLLARVEGEAIGCGALKLHGTGPAEVKRMWVSSSARGLGVGRRLLEALEQEALARGASATRLETNRSLVEAIAMYRAAGYREVPAFNDEPFAHHWFEKPLS
ncbi:MAG: GNAT family N-acetyltransferase [Acidimicrobiales bacterium]